MSCDDGRRRSLYDGWLQAAPNKASEVTSQVARGARRLPPCERQCVVATQRVDSTGSGGILTVWRFGSDKASVVEMRHPRDDLSIGSLAACASLLSFVVFGCHDAHVGASQPIGAVVPDHGAQADAAADQQPAPNCDPRNYGWVELRGGTIGGGERSVGDRSDVPIPKVTVIEDGGLRVGRSFPAPHGRLPDGVFIEVTNEASPLRCMIFAQPALGLRADGTTVNLTATPIDDIGATLLGSARMARSPSSIAMTNCLDHGESGYLPVPLKSDIVEVLLTIKSRLAEVDLRPSHCIVPRKYDYAGGKLSIELANEGEDAWPHETVAAEFITLGEDGEPQLSGLGRSSEGPLDPGESTTVVADIDETPEESTRLAVRFVY